MNSVIFYLVVCICSFEFFERLVIELLIKMVYGGSREEAGRATKKTGDEGIDGIINKVQDTGSNKDFGVTEDSKLYFNLSNPGPDHKAPTPTPPSFDNPRRE